MDPPEIRALWVDAFHAGIRSPQEADDLVAAARRANLNTLFVQVRRRGDALYAKGVEPPLDDPAYDPTFDALAYTITAAHAAGLEVHAWMNAMPTWRDELPPRDARHLFNTHGPHAPRDENWFTASPGGEHRFPVGYFVDPGHPAAAAYVAELYVSLVRNYAVDGIHFDYIRYPETEGSLPRGAAVGYNAVNLARFRRATGRADTPEPGDEAWIAWRRRQVTDLVRRVSIEARAVNPRIKISAALIPWGPPPGGENDFADAAPMQRIFQDWHQWLRDGLIDLAVPMNYARETDARVRNWFDGWIRWEKRHKHGRQLAVGLGAYRNSPEHLLAQVARARKRKGRHRADGVSFFSYASPRLQPEPAPAGALPPVAELPVAGPERLAFLADGAGGVPAAFARPAPVPEMPWIERPERGWIAGVVTAGASGPADGAEVKAKRLGGFSWFRRAHRTSTDGNGYFGFTNLKPGRYRVWLPEKRAQSPFFPGLGKTVTVPVSAGRVTRVGASGPPVAEPRAPSPPRLLETRPAPRKKRPSPAAPVHR
ncbi:MAG TPA: family 10 glycosylhydrolase [Vicinamibacterales bacterium]|nr:family 10 glycosylhydrolase [Vicinamibacterales bacterium]